MLSGLKLRIRALFYRSKLENDLDEELRFHLEREIEENITRGMTKNEARYAALRSFGGVERVKEESRDSRGIRLLEEILLDLRFSLRMLLKKPAMASIAILTLVIGIGANTAIFSVIHNILLKDLPYKGPDQLVMIWGGKDKWMDQYIANQVSDFLQWREQNIFSDIAAYSDTGFNVVGGDYPQRVQGMKISANLFHMLGVQPILGRNFQPEEEQNGKHQVVIVSYSFWKNQLSGAPDLKGKTLKLNSETYHVIGVMPEGFEIIRGGDVLYGLHSNAPNEVWTPIGFKPEDRQNTRRGLYLIGQLKPGTSISHTESRLTELVRQTDKTGGVSVIPYKTQVTGKIRKSLIVLMSAVIVVLLIACANVANLLLIQATTRYKELTLRSVLGASRSRILRQLFTEGILLSMIGCVGGVLSAYGLLSLIVKYGPDDLPRKSEISMDSRVLMFALFVSLLIGILATLAPLINIKRLFSKASFTSENRTATNSKQEKYIGNFIIVAEIAMSLFLLIGAGLLLNSFIRIVNVTPGFNPSNIFTMQLPLAGSKYSSGEPMTKFLTEALNRVKGVPGVQSASIISYLPLSGLDGDFPTFEIEGRKKIDRKDKVEISGTPVSVDYFHTMEIPLKNGRTFTELDHEKSPVVVVVNEAAARRYWQGDNPVGSYITAFIYRFQVIGVVGNVKHRGVTKDDNPRIYMHYPQLPEMVKPGMLRMSSLVLRSESSIANLLPTIREQILSIDPEQPISNIQTMTQMVSASTSTPRFLLGLIGAFGIVALLFAVGGIYGVMSYSVSRNTKEIGIRIAVGAQKENVLKMILNRGLILTLIGVGIGIALSMIFLGILKSLLYEVKPTDPITFVVTTSLLIGIALIACLVPARRATKIDPMVALRVE